MVRRIQALALGHAPSSRLAGTLGRSASRALFTPLSPGSDRKLADIDWREELVALRKLTGRALVLSSSYDTLPRGEDRAGGFVLTGLPQ